ncbi:MAG: hypothetical protein M3O22_04665 [Pseudomonadota bacterium]|nr:hypothetical protein [Pseudomonadota bacterium]
MQKVDTGKQQQTDTPVGAAAQAAHTGRTTKEQLPDPLIRNLLYLSSTLAGLFMLVARGPAVARTWYETGTCATEAATLLQNHYPGHGLTVDYSHSSTGKPSIRLVYPDGRYDVVIFRQPDTLFGSYGKPSITDFDFATFSPEGRREYNFPPHHVAKGYKGTESGLASSWGNFFGRTMYCRMSGIAGQFGEFGPVTAPQGAVP